MSAGDQDRLHQGATLGHLFARAAARFAERDALVAGDLRLTYARLADRVGAMAAVMRRAGVPQGAAIAILSHNRPDVLVAYLAAVVEGWRLTPLAAMSSVEDQVFILNDAAIDVLVIDAALADRVAPLRGGAPRLAHVFALGACEAAPDLTAATDAEPRALLEVKPRRSDVAAVYYTGGTTGRPKGVAHTHDSAMAASMMAASEWEWPQDLRMLATTPISHAAGAFAWPVFMKGGALHILETFSPEAFGRYVAREKITMTFLVPTQIYRLLDSPDIEDRGDAEDRSLVSLETVVYGAAPISPSRLADALRRFGPIFMQLYGQTEAPNCISYLSKAEHRIDDPESLGSCGVPLGAVQVELLDAEGGTVATDGIGEICVRGAFVMQGYWNRAQETAQAFEAGWLHTGDMGRFDARGRLHIVDRCKDMIISGGFNVYPSEVEAVLALEPGVAACAVVGLPDPTWGEVVVAAVVALPGLSLDVDALRQRVRERKGPVQAPKHVILAERLPITAIGKIDKKALRLELVSKIQG